MVTNKERALLVQADNPRKAIEKIAKKLTDFEKVTFVFPANLAAVISSRGKSGENLLYEKRK